MPKAFIISRRRKRNLDVSSEDDSNSLDVTAHPEITAHPETETNETKRDTSLSGIVQSKECPPDLYSMESRGLKWNSRGVLEESNQPPAVGLQHEFCAGEKKWHGKHSSNLKKFDYSDVEERHCVTDELAPNDSNQSQLNSSTLRTDSSLDSIGRSKDPRRAILFRDLEEKRADSIDLNNNNSECNLVKDCKTRSGFRNIEGDYETQRDGEKPKMPLLRTDFLGSNYKNSLFQQQSDVLCGPDFRHEVCMVKTFVGEVNGHYRTQYFTQPDSGIQQNQSPQGLTSGGVSVMSAFRSPVKPVRSDTSLPSSLSSSSLLSSTTTASLLRRLSPSHQSDEYNCNFLRYQPKHSFQPTPDVLVPTGSNSNSTVLVAKQNESDEPFSVNHNNDSAVEATRIITPTTDKKDSAASKATGNTRTMTGHTQVEVTAVITGQNNGNSTELIKDSARVDQHGTEPVKAGVYGSCASPSGAPQTADRDQRLPRPSGPKGSPATRDSHLLTAFGQVARKCTDSTTTLDQTSFQVSHSSSPCVQTLGVDSNLTSGEKHEVFQSSYRRDNEHVRNHLSPMSRSHMLGANSDRPMVSHLQLSHWETAESPAVRINSEHINHIGGQHGSSISRETKPESLKLPTCTGVFNTNPCISARNILTHARPNMSTSPTDMADGSYCMGVSIPRLLGVFRENENKLSPLTSPPRKRPRRNHRKRSFMIASLIESDSDSCSDQGADDVCLPHKQHRSYDKTFSKSSPCDLETIPPEANQVGLFTDSNLSKAHLKRPKYLPLERTKTMTSPLDVSGRGVENICKSIGTSKGYDSFDKEGQNQRHITPTKELHPSFSESSPKPTSQHTEGPECPTQSGTKHSLQFAPNSERYTIPNISVPHYPFSAPYWSSFSLDLLKLQEDGAISFNNTNAHVHRHPCDLDYVRKSLENDISPKQENYPSLFQPLPLRFLPTSSTIHPYLNQRIESQNATNMHLRDSGRNTDASKLNKIYFNPFDKLVGNSTHFQASGSSPPKPPGFHLPTIGESSYLHPSCRSHRQHTPNRAVPTNTGPTFSPCGSDGISVASSSEPGLSPTPSTNLPSPPSPRPQILGMSPRSFMLQPERPVLTPSSLTVPIMPRTKSSTGPNPMMLNNSVNTCLSSMDLGYEHLQLKMGRGGGFVDGSKSFKSFLENAHVKLEFINGGNGIKNPLLSTEFAENKIGLVTGSCNLPCPVCSLTFGTAKLLQRHLKTHREIKRFLCTFCAKGFNDTFDLKRHTRTHTGVRPYKCDMCEKAFTQRCSLESHRRKIHGCAEELAFNERRVKLYVCEDCGHSTDMAEEHYAHMRHAHPARPGVAVGVDTEVRGGGRG